MGSATVMIAPSAWVGGTFVGYFEVAHWNVVGRGKRLVL